MTSKRQEVALREAVKSVHPDSREQRPKICFLCVGDPNLPLDERVKEYKTPGSLSRLFWFIHVSRRWLDSQIEPDMNARFAKYFE
ncbi:hypothetical protein Egran_01047 [Elaphomyces granulatus]|uniref:Uncharacterized protein n=1 Tax=Elaphomyces granulatus TaxID=519963 RepID=A0A232M4C7_9EURO|nr:hypothetical protein Egran_01047 [Elaphomyces granulatus]